MLERRLIFFYRFAPVFKCGCLLISSKSSSLVADGRSPSKMDNGPPLGLPPYSSEPAKSSASYHHALPWSPRG